MSDCTDSVSTYGVGYLLDGLRLDALFLALVLVRERGKSGYLVAAFGPEGWPPSIAHKFNPDARGPGLGGNRFGPAATKRQPTAV